jgi:hypothetical protein
MIAAASVPLPPNLSPGASLRGNLRHAVGKSPAGLVNDGFGAMPRTHSRILQI